MKRISLLVSLLILSIATPALSQTVEQRVSDLEDLTSEILNPTSGSFVLDSPLWQGITNLQQDVSVLGDAIQVNSGAIEVLSGEVADLTGQVSDLNNRVTALENNQGTTPPSNKTASGGFSGFGFRFDGSLQY